MKRTIARFFAFSLAIFTAILVALSCSFGILVFRAFVVYLCFKWLSPFITIVTLPVPSFTEWAVILFLASVIRPYQNGISTEPKVNKEEQKKFALSFIPTGLLMIFIAFVLKCILL